MSAAPKWMQPLLYLAAEQLAMQWNPLATSIDFKAMAGTDEDNAFCARVVCDPMGTWFRLVVFHKATGRCVCRSQAVMLDQIDPESWEADLSPAIHKSEG